MDMLSDAKQQFLASTDKEPQPPMMPPDMYGTHGGTVVYNLPRNTRHMNTSHQSEFSSEESRPK